MVQCALVGGRFRIGTLVGRGGMAEVHLGLDTERGDAVAIKRLRPELADDPSARGLFDAEARTSSLLAHPGVVRVVATGEDPGRDGGAPIPYIAMELVRGRTLRAVVRRRSLPVHRAVAIVRDLLDALGHVHACGLVHRDVKPGNVMVTDRGITLMDFGIARPVGAPAGPAGYGTAKYLSPEQAHEDVADARSDLYATACVLYELLTGRAPFEAGAPADIVARHLVEAPAAPSTVRPELSPELDAVVLRALAKAPDERYASAAAMREALDAVPDARRPVPVPATSAAWAATDEPELVWDPPTPVAHHPHAGRSLLAAPLVAVLFLAATCGLGNVVGDVFGVERAQQDTAIAAALVAAPLGRVAERPAPASAPPAVGGRGEVLAAPQAPVSRPATSRPRSTPVKRTTPTADSARTVRVQPAVAAAPRKHAERQQVAKKTVKRHVVKKPVVKKHVAKKHVVKKVVKKRVVKRVVRQPVRKPTTKPATKPTSKPTTKPTTKPATKPTTKPDRSNDDQKAKVDKVKKKIEEATKDVEKTKSEIKKIVDDVLSKLGG